MSIVRINALSENDYEEVYSKAFLEPVFTADFSKEDLEEEFDAVERALRTALSSRWDEDACGQKDFAIADDWSGVRHHCGGIYSERIICADYPEIVAKALSSVRNGHLWTYHTAVEPQTGKHAFKWSGFFIQDSVLYCSLDDHQYDYRRVFLRG